MSAFATAAEAFEVLNMPAPSDLSRMQSLLQVASDLVRSMKGQTLTAVANDSVVLPITNSDLIFLPEHPVTTVTSVTENAVLLATTKYQLFQDVALWHVDYTPWKYGATVVYSHGYADTSVEMSLIRMSVIEAAGRAYVGSDERAPVMAPTVESSGWAPELFFTAQELDRLMSLGPVAVG